MIDEPKCEFCGKGDKDHRDPKWYPLKKIVDRLDRTNWIYAHNQCIIDASDDYQTFIQLRSVLKKLID